MKRIKKIALVILATLLMGSVLPLDTVVAAAGNVQYVFLNAYSNSAEFTAPYTGKYKIYCVGKSGNSKTTSYTTTGYGGGGSGGIAISIVTLEKGRKYPLSITSTKTSWNNDELYATAGNDNSGQTGGSGGQAYNGNFANHAGFKGGNGGKGGSGGQSSGTHGGTGGNGDNGGMKGGPIQHGSIVAAEGGGGGGGARLPDTDCSYVAASYTTTYTAGAGKGTGNGNGNQYSATLGSQYPTLSLGKDMKLYGGAGGAGGCYSKYTNEGTPGVVIIEKCSDTDLPTVTGAFGTSEWVTSAEITLAAEDATSGVVQYAVSNVKAAPASGWQQSNVFTITGNGTYYAWAGDYAGNISAGYEFTVANVDDANPVIKSVEIPDDWAASATIKIIAEDAESGVAAFACTTGSAAPETWEVDNTFEMTSNGAYYAWAKDAAGNTASKQISISKIDLTGPTIGGVTVDPAWGADSKVSVNAADNESGIASYAYSASGSNPPSFGWQDSNVLSVTSNGDFFAWAKDKVGNTSQSKAFTVDHVDGIAPVISSVLIPNSWDKESIIQILATDEGIGMGSYAYTTTSLPPEDGQWQEQDVFTISANGTYYAWAKDKVGNRSVSKQFKITKIDDNPPAINTVQFSEDANSITITASDGESGLKGIYINDVLKTSSDGSTVTAVIDPATVYSLKLVAVDQVWNRSDERTETVPDVVPPIIDGFTIAEDGTTATITASDKGSSGLKGVYVNDELEIPADGSTVTVSIDPTAIYSMKLVAVDNAGNRSAERIEKVPDVVPPTIDSVVITDDSKTATVTASDKGSSGRKGIYVNDVLKTSSSGTITVDIDPSAVYSLKLVAVDNAGNRSDERTETVPDVTPPTVDSCIFADGGISATITASDKGSSGLKGIYVNEVFHEGGTAVYNPPKGIYKLTIQAEDNAGNKSAVRTETVPDNIPPVIESVTISKDGKSAEIVLSDTGGSSVKGATINGIFSPGSLISFEIPEGTRYLTIQAEDNLGNLSNTLKKRVPGWSEVIDDIKIEPVEFSENNTKAKITATTSRADTTITGIYVNSVLYTGNPVHYKVPVGITTMTLQAVNNEGDKSVVYTLDIPVWDGGVRVTSVNFTPKSDAATIKAVDDTGIGVAGIYVNDEYFEGSTIVYNILNGTTHLQIQAVNHNGDTSDVVIKRVPGWSEITDTLAVSSVEISPNGSMATVTAESTGAAVEGIHVNDKFFEGNPILYSITSSTRTLKLQAENVEGDKSPVVYREVTQQDQTPPIVDTIEITEISLSNKIATITAESSNPDAPVSGIHINDKLYEGNPVLFPISTSVKTIKAQAVNTLGERSKVVYKEVEVSSSSSSSTSSDSSSKKSSSISITAPDWTNAARARVRIKVTDRDGIDTVEAKTDYGYEEDITDEDYFYITKDSTVTVTVTDDDDDTTKKSVDITCFDREAPTVTVSQTDNALNIRATDRKSGVRSIVVNGKSFAATSGQYRYELPGDDSIIAVQAEDKAGNLSDPVDFQPEKPKVIAPVPVANTTTTVPPTPVTTPPPTDNSDPPPEPVPEAEPTPGSISRAEAELPRYVISSPEKSNKTGAIIGLILLVLLIFGGGAALVWYNHKKAQELDGFESLEDLEEDLDFDYEAGFDEDEEEPEGSADEDGEGANIQDVDFDRREIG